MDGKRQGSFARLLCRLIRLIWPILARPLTMGGRRATELAAWREFPASSPGRKSPNGTDRRSGLLRHQFTKEIVEEGVDAAEHDQMLAARKADK